eukprot:GILJ01012914.1.p1 GENE.GILJ01012914.1~~GILJ01012914.1.p1  ORF type:complete len:1203 (+),score=201.00 GILJ01012914.1:257-3610(+)
MVERECRYVPGFYKIIDEILVNASDNRQRDSSMSRLEVTINAKEGSVSVYNNGSGIPVEMHRTEGVYIPEMIFGQLLTGSNFDDSQARVTGGSHGYGAKLTNIFSKRFIVEAADSKNQLLYRQEWSDNMSKKTAATVTPYNESDADFTRITFFPDFDRFQMKGFDEDILGIIRKRVYDLAGCNKGLEVVLNGTTVPIHSFSDYVSMFVSNEPHSELTPSAATESTEPGDVMKSSGDLIAARINNRWQIGVAPAPADAFCHVSFVNSIFTSRGGSHVNHVADQIARKVADHIKKKNPLVDVSAATVKQQLFVFVNCLVENPKFDSQLKENLTSSPQSFGSTCEISDRFIKELIARTTIVDRCIESAMQKQKNALSRKLKGSKLLDIPKLTDAALAGTHRSEECTLILTEGDSAKALAVAGLAVLGRDKYGVFPLRGKLLNVRDVTTKQLIANQEITNIVRILGLEYDIDPKTSKTDMKLRYGKVMLMTDQDHDGSHIKGLFINLVHHFWPSLLECNDFLQAFKTPLIKVRKGKEVHSFFSVAEYDSWRSQFTAEQIKQYHVKYYKGLGTSTSAEAREYFENLAQHKIEFQWKDAQDGGLIDMAFSKKRVEDRKQWLSQYRVLNEDVAAAAIMDQGDSKASSQAGSSNTVDENRLSYGEFINKELVLFSHADNARSIPSVVDGLKPSQRKVLFACFKRRLKEEVKVAQLSGYCSEHTGYHHGEVSLHSTIVNMAQDFVDSNNVPLLAPVGQFGTRLQGGDDAASARYIFTKLNPLTRRIYQESDEPLLSYNEDDGYMVEPTYFVPIIPMVLVNGCKGIGTGWSTQVLKHNPIHIIDDLVRRINGEPGRELVPWVRGFKGTIEPCEGGFKSRGIVTRGSGNTLIISELPLGRWTEDYKMFLTSLVPGVIRSFSEHHSDTDVKFILNLTSSQLNFLKNQDMVQSFKLEAQMKLSNMHLFDANGVMKHYISAKQVVDDFFGVRAEFYHKRKQFICHRLQRELRRLSNRVRFTELISAGQLQISNRKKSDIEQDLLDRRFDTDSALKSGAYEEHENDIRRSDFDYLLNTPLWNLTVENITVLQLEYAEKQQQVKELSQKTPSDLWKDDLTVLKTLLLKEGGFD